MTSNQSLNNPQPLSTLPTIGWAALIIIMAACNNSPKTTNKSSTAADSLHTALTKQAQQSYLAGFAVAIVNEKGNLYQQAYGYADIAAQKPYTKTTIQNIASISKTFIGIALLKAQEMGKLQLDDPINQYLPFKVANPNYPTEAITIRQLATHTSGIVDDETYMQKSYILWPNQQLANTKIAMDDEQVFNPPSAYMPMPEFMQQLLSKEGKWYNPKSYLKTKPGERYEYTNVGATLAALVLEKATGESFDAFTTKHILQPLGMTASGWKPDAVKLSHYSQLYHTKDTLLPHYQLITYPDGNFITSITDFSIYLKELINGYQGHGTLLSKQSYADLFKQQLTANNFAEREEQNPYNDSYNTGIFMGFSAKGNIGHTGSDPGVNTALFFNPNTGIGILLITNTNINNQKDVNTFYGILDTLTQYGPRLVP